MPQPCEATLTIYETHITNCHKEIRSFFKLIVVHVMCADTSVHCISTTDVNVYSQYTW